MKYILSLLVLLAAVSTGRAQLTNAFRAEQAQRDKGSARTLADSLGMTDKEVKAVWQARDSFLDASSTLLADARLSDADKETALAKLRQAFTQQLQADLGPDMYKRYLAYVERRMQAHGKKGKPLVGESINR